MLSGFSLTVRPTKIERFFYQSSFDTGFSLQFKSRFVTADRSYFA